MPFIKSFCRRWNQTDLYYPTLSNVAGNDLKIKGLLIGYYHAESFKGRAVINHLKLRFLRILLYYNFEELRINIETNLVKYRLLPSGQDAASAATDRILDEIDKAPQETGSKQTSKQRRQSFRRHKSIGKRWSVLALYFGLSIFLTYGSALEARV